MSSIDEAFEKVNRKDFLPSEVASYWRSDAPLHIGYNQTNSQPSVVYVMLTWLNAQSGDKILDLGSGSGWVTALLANIIGAKGHVYAVERIPELIDFGKENCRRTGVKNVSFHQAGKELGLPEKAPYEQILVSAGSDYLPEVLLNQLKVGGKIVIPVGSDILEINKISEDNIKTITHPGYIFVPLVEY